MPGKLLLRIIFGGAIATGLAHFFDFHIESFSGLKNIRNSDLIQLFRGWGFLGTWILIATSARLLANPDRPGGFTGWRRHLYRKEWLLLASPVLSGGAAETGKLLIRRLRPHGESFYIYRSWLTDPFSSSGLGFPSSHTAVAFGGSTILLLLFPKLRIPAIVMAVGCMTTRVLSGAHYFSDGVAGALIGILSGILCIKYYWYLSQKAKRGMELNLNSTPPVGGMKALDSEDVKERVQI